MTDFTKKTVWITGASSGIGKDLALHISNYQTKLILSARNQQSLEEVAHECRERGATAIVLPVNLEDEQAISAIDDAIIGDIDILIHSAGISQRSLGIGTSLTVNRRLMEINFFAALSLTKRVLPNMYKRQQGHLVIISSVVGKFGTPMRSGYAASKHAVHGYFDSLRAELHTKNIQVTLVCPGYIQTDITLRSLTADGSMYGKVDEALHQGVPVNICSQRIIKGICKNEEEFIISGAKERFAVFTKRFFPALFSKIICRIDTTK